MKRQITFLMFIGMLTLFTLSTSKGAALKVWKNIAQDEVSVSIVQPKSIPIRMAIERVNKISSSVEINYRVINLKREPITKIEWKLFVFSANGNLVYSEQWLDRLNADHHLESSLVYYLGYEPGSNDRIVIVPTKVVDESGKWEIKLPTQKERIEASLSNNWIGQFNETYEANLVLNEVEKAKLYTLALKYFIENRKNFGLVDENRLIIQREGLEAQLTNKLCGVDLLYLDSNSIQFMASQQGEIMSASFAPFEIEGTKVLLSMGYTRTVIENKQTTPCCGGFVFEYTKNQGAWRIVDVKIFP